MLEPQAPGEGHGARPVASPEGSSKPPAPPDPWRPPGGEWTAGCGASFFLKSPPGGPGARAAQPGPPGHCPGPPDGSTSRGRRGGVREGAQGESCQRDGKGQVGSTQSSASGPAPARPGRGEVGGSRLFK